MLLFLLACQDYQYSAVTADETWIQGSPGGPVDILWVVDNSCSMSEEQDLLSEHFGAFASVLSYGGVDFQIGLTTTDVEATGGTLVGAVLNPDTDSIEAEFAVQGDQGTTGSREESPLLAATLVLEADTGLIREGAGLHVILLTDEDDQSPDPVSAYVETLRALKAGETVKISAIAGVPPDGCHSPAADAVVATRIIEAVSSTGGSFHSICAADYGPVLSSLALGTADMSDFFVLTALPLLVSLEVRVDGVKMYSRPHDGWTYEAARNAIVFSGAALPRPGQGISAAYRELLGAEDTGS